MRTLHSKMNQPIPKKPTELAIDIDQWKRDIKTFTDTTSQALNAIAAELSNECSKGHGQRAAGTDGFQSPATSSDELSSSYNDPQRNQRLADLKSQLTKRISGAG